MFIETIREDSVNRSWMDIGYWLPWYFWHL